MDLKLTSLLNHIFLFISGIVIIFGSYYVKPVDELVFMKSELRSIFFVNTALLTFGIMTMFIAVCGMAVDWTPLMTNLTYQILFLWLFFGEITIFASFMVTQKITTLKANAHILSLIGLHRFATMRNSSVVVTSLSENLYDVAQQLISFHNFLECCSGLKDPRNSNEPEFLDTLCCKKGVPIPCTAKDGFTESCDKKFLHYIWRISWSAVFIANFIVLVQSISMGISIYLYRLKLGRNVDKKKN